jgi:UPF0755 protein
MFKRERIRVFYNRAIHYLQEKKQYLLKPEARTLQIRLVALLICLLLAVSAIVCLRSLMGPAAGGRSSRYVIVNVAPGATLDQVAESLADKGLIRSGGWFKLYAKLTRQDRKLQAGSYRLSSGWSMGRILDQVVSGKVAVNRVTIPEGLTEAQVGKLLVSKGLVDSAAWQEATVSGSYHYAFLQGIPQGPKQLEGFLFPATYQFKVGLTAREIVDVMLQRFGQAYTPALQQRAQQMGMTTMQVVTLASIVEREAQLDRERPLVAAVFENRLKIGMTLGSNATIDYVLGTNKDPLSYEDLRIESPYNTYLHYGLPPGPIACTGLASIKAVLNPVETEYLYFVSKGDGTGTHYFSKTLAEHEAACDRYMK